MGITSMEKDQKTSFLLFLFCIFTFSIRSIDSKHYLIDTYDGEGERQSPQLYRDYGIIGDIFEEHVKKAGLTPVVEEFLEQRKRAGLTSNGKREEEKEEGEKGAGFPLRDPQGVPRRRGIFPFHLRMPFLPMR